MGETVIRILMMLLIASVARAASTQPTFESLGQPCRAFNVLAGRAVVDTTGREWLVLTNMNETSGCELIFIDFAKNEGKTFRAPAGAGSWALDEIPGKRLVVGTYYDGAWMIFDLAAMKFIETVHVPGEQYIWNNAIGGDGRVYGGTYPGAKLAALDLNTYAVEVLGAPAPPNLYLRYVSATPDGQILCSFGMEKPATKLFDPKTKKFSEVPEALGDAQSGVSWGEHFFAGAKVLDKQLKVVDPPFPAPAGKESWSVDSYATYGETLVVRQGDRVYTFRGGEKELKLVAETTPPGGRVLASARSREILGVRGQDYFVAAPGKPAEIHPIPAQTGPRPTHFLRADDRGRVWGGPTFGQTLFFIDTKAAKTTNTSQISNHGGEVYDAAFLNGKAYAAAYSAGEIIEYDPDQPWDQINGKNPRTIASVYPGYNRPIGGIVVGPDKKLYSGWMAKYGVYGGCIAITNTTDGKTDRIDNPLGGQAISGVAVDEKFIYAGSSLDANGLPNKTGESARFGMIERESRKVAFKQDLAGVANVSHFCKDAKTNHLLLEMNGQIKFFDPQTHEFAIVSTTAPAPAVGTSIAGRGDGVAYYGSGDSLLKVDVASRVVTLLAKAPGNISCVAIDPAGELFVSCGIEVYRVAHHE